MIHSFYKNTSSINTLTATRVLSSNFLLLLFMWIVGMQYPFGLFILNLVLLPMGYRYFTQYVSKTLYMPIYVTGGVVGMAFYLLLNFEPTKHTINIALLTGVYAALIATLLPVVMKIKRTKQYFFLLGQLEVSYVILGGIFLVWLAFPDKASWGTTLPLLAGGFLGVFMTNSLKSTPQPNSRKKHQTSKNTQASKSSDIFDKYNNKGYTALTKEEKKELFKSGGYMDS